MIRKCGWVFFSISIKTMPRKKQYWYRTLFGELLLPLPRDYVSFAKDLKLDLSWPYLILHGVSSCQYEPCFLLLWLEMGRTAFFVENQKKFEFMWCHRTITTFLALGDIKILASTHPLRPFWKLLLRLPIVCVWVLTIEERFEDFSTTCYHLEF